MYVTIKKDSMKCVKCRVELSEFRSAMSRYCPRCRDVVRKESQAKYRERAKLKRLRNPVFQAKSQFKKYKYTAPRRGLVFDLTVDDFVSAVDKPCYYCGQDYHGVGFDRVSNDVGYITENIVPCCEKCNRMKHSSDKEDFISICKKIAENHS
jgi:hypothetical protein